MAELEKKFVFLYEKLNVVNTENIVKKYIKPVNVEIKKPEIASAEKFDGAD